ncbi:MAG: Sua5/YciO/YrdC/YwlC family protein, partial [Tepidisphaeraceae bacterium]
MQAQIVQILNAPDYPQEIQRAAELLAAGKLVVLPTETVYGVAGVLTNAEVRSSLAQIRGSAKPKPFTIHLARPGDAVQYLGEANDFARRVIHKLWPGPVGLVFDVAESRRREVASELGVEPGDLYDGASI